MLEAAVIGVPDAVRGQVARAYVVARGSDTSGGVSADAVVADIQAFMKRQLSQHEYPRQIEIVSELPKTPAGKVNRKVLRDRAAQSN